MSPRVINFGVIGCGLMGREFASAAARWCHLGRTDFQPRIIAACDPARHATQWFSEQVPTLKYTTTDYHQVLADDSVEAVYCAVPHDLHGSMYCDIISAGKHLLGEKPFGIDIGANRAINQALSDHPGTVVRCASEFPFFPAAQQITRWVDEGRFGRIIDVEAGLWHSSDLNPLKPINWKRVVATNGEYGCMGDLGMHALHLPLRYGWVPQNVRALLSKVVEQRPDEGGTLVPCETWDNATLACEVKTGSQQFPMLISTKRIAPGHANTWFLKINGTTFSASYSTRNPKRLCSMPYRAEGEQAWHVVDAPHAPAYPVITGGIFEFGFSDSILQMWAAFCDEVAHGRDGMAQGFYCATPEEATASHQLMTAALRSHAEGAVARVDPI